MDLQKLFETQKILDKHILDKHNLHGEDLLDKKILALQVELGELANEWRGFKFWSEDQEPNTDTFRMVKCNKCKGNVELVESCETCWGRGAYSVGRKNPLLEEYVDGLHFILGIGNDYGFKAAPVRNVNTDNIIETFASLFEIIPSVKGSIKNRFFGKNGHHIANLNFQNLIDLFYKLGEQLDFTWQQIEQAYFAKNKVNHERQEQGY